MPQEQSPASERSHGAGSAQVAPPPDQLLLQIGCGYMLSASLQVATRLGIADQLASGARHSSALANAVGADEDALYRVLRALATVGIFSEVSPRTFALTPAAELLRTGGPRSMHDLVSWLSNPFHLRVYAEMLHSVQTGKPAGDKVVGMPVFEYLARDKELSASFNDAMTNFSASLIPAVLDAYDFSGITTLVDVAGGHGEALVTILGRYPNMRGVLFDVDHVIEGATSRIAAIRLQNRCGTESGDFFTSVPRGGDAYLMKHIIHDWDDQRAGVILRNIRAALDGVARGKVILIESVIQPGNQADLAKVIDLEMLILPGGRERTADEFAALFASAGFEMTGITPTPSPVCVIEARPRRTS